MILAIILDRLTFAAGEWLDPRVRRAAGPPRAARIVGSARRSRSSCAGLLAPLVVDATAFPDAIAFSFHDPVNAIVGWVDGHLLAASPIAIKNVDHEPSSSTRSRRC